tara:strand:+ start:8874 stop:9335 length:462 start_codon:yes stop_codon:yes gene_type:complete
MNIGEIKQQNGRLLGAIATRSIDLPQLGLRPVQSQNERAPAYEIVTLNVGKRWVQIGALWPQTSNATGEVFLQGSIDDPSLPEPLSIALFGTDEEGYRVAWRRPQRRDDFGPVTRGGRGTDVSPGGAFGESTAGVDGALMGVGGDIDDEIPFS